MKNGPARKLAALLKLTLAVKWGTELVVFFNRVFDVSRDTDKLQPEEDTRGITEDATTLAVPSTSIIFL